MSAATPTASTPDPSTPAPPSTESNQATLSADRLILEHLRARGYKVAEQAVNETLGSSDDKGKSPVSISGEELIKKLTLFAEKPAQPGENTLKTSLGVQKELATVVNSSNLQNLIASIGPVGAEEILSLDPNDKQEGFRELEAWAEGSLDIYRVRSTRSSCYLFLTTRLSPSSVLLSFPYFVISIWTSSSLASKMLVSTPRYCCRRMLTVRR
jgi:transcription initiation factor TFIID subunit 5